VGPILRGFFESTLFIIEVHSLESDQSQWTTEADRRGFLSLPIDSKPRTSPSSRQLFAPARLSDGGPIQSGNILEGLVTSSDTEEMDSKQGRKKASKTPPACGVILLCDAVIRDEATHKSSVIGIFDTFVLQSLPGQTSPCGLFLHLVDAVGRFAITAEVHDVAQRVVLFRSPGVGEFGDPTIKTSGELWLPVSALTFDQTGAYEMVVFADNSEVGRIQFSVKLQDS
jgi:hypothetical protein